jgi:hypothetical protein
VTADWLGDESDMHSTNLNTYVVSGDNLFLREYGTTFPLQITESTPNTLVYEATQVTASGVPMDTTVRLALHDHHLTSSAISTMNGVTVSDVEFSADY